MSSYYERQKLKLFFVFVTFERFNKLFFDMNSFKFFLIFAFGLAVSCSDDDGSEPTPTDDNNNNDVTSCESLPQFPDAQHEMIFSTVGNSCVKNDYYNNIQLGSATLVYSDGSQECMSPTEFYKFHMGYADVNSVENTFDVDIYILGSVKPQVNDQIDLSDSTINTYYSYQDNGVIKSAKAISGSVNLSSTSENADMYGEFQFTGVEFEFNSGVDRYVLGDGNFVQGGDTIKVEGKFLAQDHGLSPDCE